LCIDDIGSHEIIESWAQIKNQRVLIPQCRGPPVFRNWRENVEKKEKTDPNSKMSGKYEKN
jgi:hypothetical protein